MPNPAALAYIERQSIAYEQHREQLLQNYKGQYVLFENGNVLDADIDFDTLVLRVIAQSGPRDVFIQHSRCRRFSTYCAYSMFIKIGLSLWALDQYFL